jgi:hypothetical protein
LEFLNNQNPLSFPTWFINIESNFVGTEILHTVTVHLTLGTDEKDHVEFARWSSKDMGTIASQALHSRYLVQQSAIFVFI